MRKVLLILLAFILLVAPVQLSCRSYEISRLSIPAREGGYDNFKSTFIVSHSRLDDFISDVEQQDHWNNKMEFLLTVSERQIDLSTHNIVLFRHDEGSGSIVVTIGEPRMQADGFTINVFREIPPVLSDDMAFYCYAYKVSKDVASITFVVEGRDDVSFRLNDGEIVVE